MTKTDKQETRNEVATVQGGATDVAVPSFLQGIKREDRSGLDAKDLTIPRIKIAQDGNPEVKKGDVPKGALFLNVTGEVLAEFAKPLTFIPIIAAKEYMLWRDQNDDGGGLLARARPVFENGRVRYKWDKPNSKFTTKIKGVVAVEWHTAEYLDEPVQGDKTLADWGTQIASDPDSPPAASVHYNYLVALPEHGNMIAAFSLSKSQVKRAKDLNAILEMSQYPVYARIIRAATEPEKNSNNQEFFNVRFKPAGLVQDEALFTWAKTQHEYYAANGFVVDQENPDRDDAANSKAGGKF